jgi:cbb3-type cytochrome oxidase subunit 3
MLASTNNDAMNATVAAAAVVGPLLAIAIFWFGLRSGRKHDRAEAAASRPPAEPD